MFPDTNQRPESFEEFYQSKITPILPLLNASRHSAKKWIIRAAASGLGIIILFAMSVSDYDGAGYFCLIALIFLIYSIYRLVRADDDFIETFKTKIIGEIILFVHPGMVYRSGSYISMKRYARSGLYTEIVNEEDGDDYMKGSYRGLNFCCSELHTYKRDRYSRRYNLRPMFDGLFMAVQLRSFVQGGTYMWRKGHNNLPNTLGDQLRRYDMPEVHRVSFGDPEFEKQFSIYTTDPSEASTILDAETRQGILRLKAQLQRNISLSFVSGHFYIAIPLDEELLEPPLKELDNKEAVKKYFFTVLLIFDIMHKLRLERFA